MNCFCLILLFRSVKIFYNKYDKVIIENKVEIFEISKKLKEDIDCMEKEMLQIVDDKLKFDKIVIE